MIIIFVLVIVSGMIGYSLNNLKRLKKIEEELKKIIIYKNTSQHKLDFIKGQLDILNKMNYI